MNRRLLTTSLLVALCACHSSGRASDAGVPAAPPKLTLGKDRTDLLFTFVDENGKLVDVQSADKVPQDRRKTVLVRDLSKRAEEVRADQYVYLADLTREEDGAWPYAVVSRYGVDRSLRDGDFVLPADEADGGEQRVVLYGTSWCGACAQARSWLKSRGVSFSDRDVEKDERAAREMQAKLKRAGIPFGGVPVIDVMGQLLLGFDPGKMERLLKST
jgi:glutaredoxin